MIPKRMSRTDYLEARRSESRKRNKSEDTKHSKGLTPFRRPLDANGNKLKGEAYREWLDQQKPC